MQRRKFLTVATATAGGTLLAGNAAAADDLPDLPALVRRYVTRALEAGSPSVVCGVIHGGRRHVAGAGEGPGGAAPDGRTVYQLGSIAKTLTATALARAVCAGTTRLDAPLTLPARFPVPHRGPRPITLVDLATHSSGLPSLPPNLAADADPYDPYAHYTLDDLASGLGETTLATEPGSRYAYSNFGVGLLGQALAFDAVDAMLRRRVAEPLGLKDTTTALRPDMAARKAVGHFAGQPVPDWRDRVLSAAGTSMYSTADDMVRFLSAQLRPGRSPLRAAIELTQRPHFTAEDGLRLGLGWHLSPLPGGRTMTWHNGGTGGFSTCAAFSRESGSAVVMMVNTFNEQTATDPRPVDALTFGLLGELTAV
ncbi:MULTISPECIES: serine hydrolase domain-containing protein [Streptomyces]|uniref:Serine hydrolase domain-containing protein n=1 Tax=Streptomyces lonegramiae TaxID=3075524 RepID=A0ABU2XR20_9ACTN|nr:serine hydrolase domain-containing protein [Streptomyces sp. DSM 41529]MDT0548371.1 serine hydrolase domain-containing protein [Streptomyces sp. DSM 41529]